MLQLPIYKSSTNFNSLPNFNSVGQFLNFSPQLAWLAMGLLVVIFLIASFILFYHWKKFGFEKFVMAKMAILYFSLSVVLLITTVISIAVYLSSLS